MEKRSRQEVEVDICCRQALKTTDESHATAQRDYRHTTILCGALLPRQSALKWRLRTESFSRGRERHLKDEIFQY